MQRVLDDQAFLPERTSGVGVRVHDLRYPGDVQIQNLTVVTVQREHGDRRAAWRAIDDEAGDVLLESNGYRVVKNARTRAVEVGVRDIWDGVSEMLGWSALRERETCLGHEWLVEH